MLSEIPCPGEQRDKEESPTQPWSVLAQSFPSGQDPSSHRTVNGSSLPWGTSDTSCLLTLLISVTMEIDL